MIFKNHSSMVNEKSPVFEERLEEDIAWIARIVSSKAGDIAEAMGI